MAFQSYDDAGFGATLNLEEIAADGRYLFYIFFDIIIITACPTKWVPDLQYECRCVSCTHTHPATDCAQHCWAVYVYYNKV